MSNNEKIPWDNRYTLGIETLDTQHKKLFALVNRLYDLDEHKNTKEDLRIILYEFSEYMKTHFKEEEEYMSSIGYDKLYEHKELHKELIDYLAFVIKSPAKLEIIKTKMRVVAKRALIDHIMNEDTKIKLFVIENDCDEEMIFDISDMTAD
jgi:hemerythrin